LTPTFSYFICTLPRSGSWLLSESLEKTGIAGRPREYFEPKLFAELSSAERAEALDKIFQKGTTQNGVFSAKLHWYQFEYAPHLLSNGKVDGLPVPLLMAEHFPSLRYIWLTRRDKVRQAISYFRASTTGQWWKIPGVNAEEEPAIPEFDFDRILYLETLLVNHEAKWQKYFDEHDLDPLVIIFEELVENLSFYMTEILDHVGIPYPIGIEARNRLLRQSDALTEQWIERYIAMKQARAEQN
jgi:trehalose 2-sulfotransferase